MVGENDSCQANSRSWQCNYGEKNNIDLLGNCKELNNTLRAFGAYLFDKETGLDTGLKTPAAAEALEYIYNTVHVWKISDPHFTITSGLGTGLETGYAATHAAGSWIKGMIDVVGVVKDWTAVRWRVGPIDTVFLWAWLYGINPDSPHKKEASKWLTFLAREETTKWEANNYGHLRGRKDWESWDYFKKNPDLKIFMELKPEGKYQDYTYDFLPQSKMIMALKQNIEQKGMNWQEARKITIESFDKDYT